MHSEEDNINREEELVKERANSIRKELLEIESELQIGAYYDNPLMYKNQAKNVTKDPQFLSNKFADFGFGAKTNENPEK